MSPRLNLEALRSRRARSGGVLLAVGATLAVALPACGGGGSEATKSGYTVRAIFDSAAFIQEGLDVKIAGVNVGQVLGVELTDENQAAVTFTITEPGFQDLREDAKCMIRPSALIGERYIECSLTEPRPEGASPPPELQPMATGDYEGERLLPIENTAVPIDADLLLNTSNLSARERLAIIIRELGVGLQGRGDKLAVALDKGNEALVLTNRVLKQLSEQSETLKELTTSSDRVLASLAAERAALSGTIENGATVSSTLANRKTELAGTIASLDRVLTEIEPSTNKALELTDELAPIASDLNASADDLAVVLNDLPELAARGEAGVVALGPTADKGREVLTSDETSALIDRFGKVTSVANTTGKALGLALGDLRTTGGLDYFMDVLYGVAYATNGRDASGAFLRASALNAASCIDGGNLTNAAGCKQHLSTETINKLSAADRAAGSTATGPGRAAATASSNAGSAAAAETETGAASRLLFGGTR